MIIKNKPSETDQKAIARVQKWSRRKRMLYFKTAMKRNEIPTRIKKWPLELRLSQFQSINQNEINRQFPWFKKYQENMEAGKCQNK